MVVELDDRHYNLGGREGGKRVVEGGGREVERGERREEGESVEGRRGGERDISCEL